MKTFGCCHLLLFLQPIMSLEFIFGSPYSVRALVTKHAFTSYVMHEIVNEVVDKPVILHNILDLTNPRLHFGFELTTISIISYVVYKYHYVSIYSFYEKFKKLPDYNKYYRKFQFCILILTMVLTKEIQNAI